MNKMLLTKFPLSQRGTGGFSLKLLGDKLFAVFYGQRFCGKIYGIL